MKTKIRPRKRVDKVLKELGELYDFNRKIQNFRFLEKKAPQMVVGNDGEPTLRKVLDCVKDF